MLRFELTRIFAFVFTSIVLISCGAKTGLDVPDVVRRDVVDTVDVGPDACVPAEDRCGGIETCGNGTDDNCDGRVDEACACAPGSVQSCFSGPPGRRNVGACRDGSQTCLMSGTWGSCTGGVLPTAESCNGADNVCNGCSMRQNCPITCPGPNDARVPDGTPFERYPLRGEQFFAGTALSWRWRITGGPCDQLSVRPSFDLQGETTRDATFVPVLSGDYTVKLIVEVEPGMFLSCTWIVHVAGPGLRVEMCYPENTTVDLDLYLHRPGSRLPWYSDPDDVFHPQPDSCNWSNCEATLRSTEPRADWGYAASPLSACVNGPHGPEWQAVGNCSNPRLDIDNNLAKASGTPENINVDSPREGESFRIMVQNFSGDRAHPLVNVYCSGHRVATFGLHPDEVPNFIGRPPPAVGAMWRVADVTTHRDAAGETNCNVTALHRRNTSEGYDVTFDNPAF